MLSKKKPILDRCDIGYGYLVKIPLAIPDKEILETGANKGLLVLCGGWERDYVLKSKQKHDGTSYWEAILQIKQVEGFKPTTAEEEKMSNVAELSDLISEWFSRMHELAKFFYEEGDNIERLYKNENFKETPLEVKIFGWRRPQNIEAGKETQIGSYLVTLKAESSKKGVELKKSYFYDLTVVEKRKDSNEDMARIRELLPVATTIRPVCNR